MKVKEAIEQARNNDDLWSQLDEAIKEVAATPSRPPNTFTRAEFAERHKVDNHVAYRMIMKLIKAGKVFKEGSGNAVYYQLVKP